MEEIWKDIEGYEGYYQVSNLGRVRSLDRYITGNNGAIYLRQGQIKEIKPHHSGYLFVSLMKNRKRKIMAVHRLVAEAFIPNPDNLPQINHKDEDKTNNRVENLEWCTGKYNCNYGTHNKRVSDKLTNGKTSKEICQYTKEGILVRKYPSASEAARQFRGKQGNISQVCLGKRNSAYGYLWKYNV